MTARLGEGLPLPDANCTPSSEAKCVPGPSRSTRFLSSAPGPVRPRRATVAAIRAAAVKRSDIGRSSTPGDWPVPYSPQASCRCANDHKISMMPVSSDRRALLSPERALAGPSRSHLSSRFRICTAGHTRSTISERQTKRAEVGVLGDDDVVIVARNGGDRSVVGLSQTKIVDVSWSPGKRSAGRCTSDGLRFSSKSSFTQAGEWSHAPAHALPHKRGKQDVFAFQIGEVGEDFFDAHVGGQIFEHIGDRHAHARTHGFPPSLPGSTVMRERQPDMGET